jgi:uncharacterized protein YcbK (DUF882 family)
MSFFKRSEFACKCGCGFDTVDYELIEVLNDIRTHFKTPVIINSGCRCEDHNRAVGGSSNSQHLYGRAADIVVLDVAPQEVYDFVDSKYFGLGLGLYSNWVHIDTRTNGPARWK